MPMALTTLLSLLLFLTSRPFQEMKVFLAACIECITCSSEMLTASGHVCMEFETAIMLQYFFYYFLRLSLISLKSVVRNRSSGEKGTIWEESMGLCILETGNKLRIVWFQCFLIRWYTGKLSRSSRSDEPNQMTSLVFVFTCKRSYASQWMDGIWPSPWKIYQIEWTGDQRHMGT